MPCNQRHCKENSLKRGGQMANPLLQHYIKLTEFLGQALGPDYEVALHDMTDKNRSIVAIANNHISLPLCLMNIVLERSVLPSAERPQ